MKRKVGIYPGSFNPWHRGHSDILAKALDVFDYVVVVQCINPEKPKPEALKFPSDIAMFLERQVEFRQHDGLLVDFIAEFNAENWPHDEATAVIRGLRNGADLQYEQNLQYWNEDLGMDIPTVFFVAGRDVSHYSSSALRDLKKFGKVIE